MEARRTRCYIDSTEQLVTEVFAGDVRRSVDFYRRLGFGLLRDGGDFVELAWEDHAFFVAAVSAFPQAPAAVSATGVAVPKANVRVMVRDVDERWALAVRMGALVSAPGCRSLLRLARFHHRRSGRIRHSVREPRTLTSRSSGAR